VTPSILVTSRSFSSGTVDAAARLNAAGYDVVAASPSHEVDSLAPHLEHVVAWIAGTAPVTAEHLALAPSLRVVARYGVGVDSVDIAAADARGVLVTNTPGANSESVADLALALLLASLRTVNAGDRAVRAGDWNAIRGREIASLTVGVAGFGRIGRSFAARVVALGARVRAFDPYLPVGSESPDGVTLVSTFDELAECDALSLHAPGGQCLITAEWLEGVAGIALVNTARGDLVDEAALAAALRAGAVSSYAADTLDGEGGADSASPLLATDLADRVTITPHLGAQTVDAVDRMGVGAVDNVLAVLGGTAPPNPVRPAPVSTLGKAVR